MTPEQLEYMKYNTTKPANKQTWLTFHFSQTGWTEDINLVAIEDYRSVEDDLSVYTFEGVLYQPVSMSVSLPNESKDSNGKMTLSFPRIATTVKKLMKERPLNTVRDPITAVFRQYQEGVTLPVRTFTGSVAKDFPKIGGMDVSVQISSYNPNTLVSNLISTIEQYPELRRA